MKYIIQLLSLVILMTTSSTAMATSLCSYSDVQLDFVQLASGDEDPLIDPDNPLTIGPVNSSDCVILLGNDQPIPKGKDSTNIGTYQDGFMNGEGEYYTVFDPFYLDENVGDGDFNENLLFIDPTIDLQKLDGEGDPNSGFNDPGWIYLGKDEGDGFGYGVEVGKGLEDMVEVTPLVDTPEGLEGLVDINFYCGDGEDPLGGNCTQGSWSIEPNPDIVGILDDLIGEGFFDQLAFVFKTGNVCHPPTLPEDIDLDDNGCIDIYEGPEFSIYNFDFGAIFEDFNALPEELGLGTASLELPYNLGGTFDLGSTFLNKDISHISVWVRDPADFTTTTEMPEPKSTMLMLFALALLVLRFKSKHLV